MYEIVLGLLIFALGVAIGMFVRGWFDFNKTKNIGVLTLDFDENSDDPLRLRISEDIDIGHPPKQVAFDLEVHNAKSPGR